MQTKKEFKKQLMDRGITEKEFQKVEKEMKKGWCLLNNKEHTDKSRCERDACEWVMFGSCDEGSVSGPWRQQFCRRLRGGYLVPSIPQRFLEATGRPSPKRRSMKDPTAPKSQKVPSAPTDFRLSQVTVPPPPSPRVKRSRRDPTAPKNLRRSNSLDEATAALAAIERRTNKAKEHFSKTMARIENRDLEPMHKLRHEKLDIAGSPASASTKSRSLAGCGLSDDLDAPHGMFILAPILIILMLVLFIFPKPLRQLLSRATKKPSTKGSQGTRKRPAERL